MPVGSITTGRTKRDSNRRVATYVHKMLKGAMPGDLPVEQPTKVEFAINLQTAKKIGLTIPPEVFARANKLIKESKKTKRRCHD